MYQINILLIEDDPRIREIVGKYIQSENYVFFEAESGKQAQEKLDEREYQLILLDVMLSDTDGWSILKNIRKKSNVPVVMLSARAEEDDKLFGFDLGADDYVTKPFSGKELVARIKAVLKRNNVITNQGIIKIGGIEINTAYHQVSILGEEIELTPLEYSLFFYLIDHRNIALTRNQLLDGVWGYDYFGDDRTVDTHIKRLRQKLGNEGEQIKTIRGIGYRLVVAE